jgi:hypothetical protein
MVVLITVSPRSAIDFDRDDVLGVIITQSIILWAATSDVISVSVIPIKLIFREKCLFFESSEKVN